MKRLEEVLEGVKTLLITGHVRPDGDCVGSCLAVKNYVERVCPEVRVTVCLEPFSKDFAFLKGAEQVVKEVSGPFDLALSLDASSRDRLCEGVSEAFDSAVRRVCIDHHVTNTGYADESHVEAEASSTCEVLFGLMDESVLTREVAECLYLGMVHDTGVFKHSNTKERTMAAAGRLISLGARPDQIIDETFYKKTFLQNRALGKALCRAELFLQGKVIGSYLTRKDMEAIGVSSRDLDGIIDQLRVTEGTECAVFLYELEPGVFKASLRANGSVDVSRAAFSFGGGGHVKAAGCQLSGTPEEVLSKLLTELSKQL